LPSNLLRRKTGQEKKENGVFVSYLRAGGLRNRPREGVEELFVNSDLALEWVKTVKEGGWGRDLGLLIKQEEKEYGLKNKVGRRLNPHTEKRDGKRRRECHEER